MLLSLYYLAKLFYCSVWRCVGNGTFIWNRAGLNGRGHSVLAARSVQSSLAERTSVNDILFRNDDYV